MGNIDKRQGVEIDKRAQKIIKDNPEMNYSQAVLRVFREDPKLYEEYNNPRVKTLAERDGHLVLSAPQAAWVARIHQKNCNDLQALYKNWKKEFVNYYIQSGQYGEEAKFYFAIMLAVGVTNQEYQNLISKGMPSE